MLTLGSCLGGLWRGRCRGVGEGGSSLEGRRRARARDARADNRAPEWSAGGRGRREGAGAGVRTPPARPCGAGEIALPNRDRGTLPFAAAPQPGLSGSKNSVLSPRPPSLPPFGPRCALRDLGRAAAAPSPLYCSCQRRRRLLAAAGEPRLLAAPDGAAGGRERALARSRFLGTRVARFGPFAQADPASYLGAPSGEGFLADRQ